MPYLDAAGSSSLLGQVIDGRYKIFKKLGEGGMGEVYAAEHVHIDKKFAIKLLKTEIVSNPEAVTRFQQEARSSSSIKHRNIIAIEDFGKLADGRIYMCMELLDGQALNDLIQSPQTIERLLNILIQTGHGLAAAHARNIVHRDMKPENIFVTFQNNEDIPKILDFGIAKVAGNEGQNNLTRTGTIFGTPFYMAPEQALGNPVDARTDIYAMGVIMYEVFAGSLPFQGESFMGILTQHITTDPEHVAQRAAKANRPLPPGLAEIIMACLQKNPAQRFGTMDELVNQLIAVYRRVAGAGMSTYMEAFPMGASAMHPVQTPGPMSAPHGIGAVSKTVGVGAPPGVMPSGGHPYVPASGSAPAVMQQSSSSSGLYDPSQSNLAPKKGNTGLIIAILAVLAVGGGIAAFVILGQKDGKAGDGSGSQVASGDGPGTNTKLGNDVSDGGVAATTPDAKQVAAGGTPDAAALASTPDAAESTVAPDAAVVQPASLDAGSEPLPKEIDAGVLAPKVTQVSLVGMNVSTYDVYVDGAVVPLVGGDHVIDVPEGKKLKVTIKAKGFKDKDVVLDGKSRIAKFSASKIPVVTSTGNNGSNTTNNNGSNTPPPANKCTGTSADLSRTLGPTCAAKFCRDHTDPKSQSACEVYNN